MACSSPLHCKIGPSILNADLSCLYDECNKLIESGADYLHLDVMDGHFVNNITFGPPVVESLRKKLPTVYIEVHMMVSNPELWIVPMKDAGVNRFTFHIEATRDSKEVLRLVKEIRDNDMDVGIALSPETEVEVAMSILNIVAVDIVLIMTVKPGLGGQKFLPSMMPKVQFIRSKYHNLDIAVDGGINEQTIDAAAQSGANLIVVGTAVVKAKDPKGVIENLRNIVNKWIQCNSTTFAL